MKRILLLLLTITLLASKSYASHPHFYLGGQGGLINTNLGISNVMTAPSYGSLPIYSANVHNHVYGVRGYAGYLFNDYLAIEGGYLRIRRTRYTDINDGSVPTGNLGYEWAGDLRGRLTLPMASYVHLDPYIELGGAYVHIQPWGGITTTSNIDNTIHPLMSAGLGFYITPDVTLDVSWTSIFKSNTSLPRIDMYMLGATYHFMLDSISNYGASFNDGSSKD